MSAALIARSPDLERLQAEGYDIEIIHAHLVVRGVPYVTADGEVGRGDLVSTLNLGGNKAVAPDTHVVMFRGQQPCDAQGRPLTAIINASDSRQLAPGLEINFTFSSKPAGGYPDYYEKMTAYVRMLEGPAQAIDPDASARKVRPDAA
jgi:hypothetical protein